MALNHCLCSGFTGCGADDRGRADGDDHGRRDGRADEAAGRGIYADTDAEPDREAYAGTYRGADSGTHNRTDSGTDSGTHGGADNGTHDGTDYKADGAKTYCS